MRESELERKNEWERERREKRKIKMKETRFKSRKIIN